MLFALVDAVLEADAEEMRCAENAAAFNSLATYTLVKNEREESEELLGAWRSLWPVVAP